MSDKEYLQKLAISILSNRAEVDDVKQGEKDLLATAKENGVHIAAFKSALKLKKLGSGECADWLRAFRLYADALGLDAQGELALPEPAEPTASKVPESGLGGGADAPGSYRVKH